MAAGGRRPESQGCSPLVGSPHDADTPADAADSPPAAEPVAPPSPPLSPPPPTLPAAFSHRVPHFQQVHNWDCGLACVLMVLRALGMRQHNMATLQRLCPTHSIWTIDLAHLLAACGARVQMLTITIGANQAYSGERFYAEHMPSDSSRVETLFQAAPGAGIPVHQRSLPLADLKALLLGGACLPLVLVDKITLGGSAAAQHSSWEAERASSLGQDDIRAVAPNLAGPLSRSGGVDAAAARTPPPPAAAAEDAPAAVDPRREQAQQQAQRQAQQQALEQAAAAPAVSASPLRQGVPMPPAARITSPGCHPTAAAASGVVEIASPQPAAVEDPSLSCPGSPVGYLGHYVVLVGYDARSDEFEYRDPSSESARLWVPAQRLEAARKCFGTDEDLLLVEVPSASPCCASAGGISSDGGAAAGAVAEGSRLVPPEAANVEQQQQPEDWGAAGPSPRIVYG